jgi:hypothetical protein
MPLLRPYTTVERLRDFIGNFDSENEDRFIDAINRASRLIEAETKVQWWFNDYSVTPYTVPRRDVLGAVIVLPWPIITLTEVVQDSETLIEGASEGDYYFEAGETVVRASASWGGIPYAGTITLRGTFGFALDESDPTGAPPPTLPAHIAEMALEIAAVFSGFWRRSIRAADGTSDTAIVQSVPATTMSRLRAASPVMHRRAF